MATYRKRGDTWRVEVWVGGVRDSATFRSKAAAKAWAVEREDELGKGGPATTQRTLRDVLEHYRDKVAPTHRGSRWEKIRLDKIARDLGETADRPLRELTGEDVGSWRDARLRAVAPPSVAREMGLLRAALSHACREWQWLTRQKLDDLRGVRKPPSAPPRRRRITPAEVTAIVEALGYAEGEAIKTKSQRVTARVPRSGALRRREGGRSCYAKRSISPRKNRAQSSGSRSHSTLRSGSSFSNAISASLSSR